MPRGVQEAPGPPSGRQIPPFSIKFSSILDEFSSGKKSAKNAEFCERMRKLVQVVAGSAAEAQPVRLRLEDIVIPSSTPLALAQGKGRRIYVACGEFRPRGVAL